jgi:hypothetical protein
VVISLTVGVSLHFDRKFSQLPFTWHKVGLEHSLEAEREAVIQEIYAPVDVSVLPYVIRNVRLIFPTPASMRTSVARVAARAWGNGKKFQTAKSERGHALERTMLNSASAPGQSFHHHAREYILSQVRTRHIRAGGFDPRVYNAEGAIPFGLADGPSIAPTSILAKNHLGEWERKLHEHELLLASGNVEIQLSLADITKQARVASRRPTRKHQAALVDDTSRRHLALEDASIAIVADKSGAAAMDARGRAGCSGRGGSQMQTYMNAQRRNLKAAVGGRTLDSSELEALRVRSLQTWNALPADGATKRACGREYAAQVALRQAGGSLLPIADDGVQYKNHFGFGNRASPVPVPDARAWLKRQAPTITEQRVYKTSEFIIFHEDVLADEQMLGT